MNQFGVFHAFNDKEHTMDKIPSFTVNHLELQAGVYVSRIDKIGKEVITTFDLRMKRPNMEPVINTAEMHTIEHIAATYLRNHKDYKDKTIYFGPMGCRTGFYLILAGSYESVDIVPLVRDLFNFISNFEEEIPGASARDCGNYLDMNLSMARYEAKRFFDQLEQIAHDQLGYPQ